MKSALDTLLEWAKDNGLGINLSKYELVLFILDDITVELFKEAKDMWVEFETLSCSGNGMLKPFVWKVFSIFLILSLYHINHLSSMNLNPFRRFSLL